MENSPYIQLKTTLSCSQETASAESFPPSGTTEHNGNNEFTSLLSESNDPSSEISQNSVSEESSNKQDNTTIKEKEINKSIEGISDRLMVDIEQSSITVDVNLTPSVSEKSLESVKKSPETSDDKVCPKLVEEKNCESVDDKVDEIEEESEQKERSMSLSREMRNLINSARDSKIINDSITQVKSKIRSRSRGRELDTSGVESLNASLDTEQLVESRRSSDTSMVSITSDIVDKTSRRNMRSSDPSFVSKQKKFLSSITGKVQKDEEAKEEKGKMDIESLNMAVSESESEDGRSVSVEPASQNLVKQPARRLTSDKYCWRCHWVIESLPNGAEPPHCSVCPRSYHPKSCLSSKQAQGTDKDCWVCPECITVLNAEAAETRSPAMQKTSLSTLCTLLNYALTRMKLVNGAEEFLRPVDTKAFPDYREHVVHVMDLGRMQQNIVDGLYGSTEAFLADTLWILHNCLVYNSPVRSRLTVAARALVRECRKEIGEIETCPECYAAAHARKPTWFTDVCSTPHILLWAKLKGFPYWPAKGMTVNESGMVDVRFFGDHDRAWVPAKYCYLYSQKDPNNAKTQRADILESIKEAEQHTKSITRKFGNFVHAAPLTPFDPTKRGEQLRMMIPGYTGVLPPPRRVKESHSNSSSSSKGKRPRLSSKCSKDSNADEYATDDEDIDVKQDRVISVNESINVEKYVEVEVPDKSPERPGQKRKRQTMEEATAFSVLDTSRKRKRNTSLDTSSRESTPAVKDKNIEETEKMQISTEEPESKKGKIIVKISRVTVKSKSTSPTKNANVTSESKAETDESVKNDIVDEMEVESTNVKLDDKQSEENNKVVNKPDDKNQDNKKQESKKTDKLLTNKSETEVKTKKTTPKPKSKQTENTNSTSDTPTKARIVYEDTKKQNKKQETEKKKDPPGKADTKADKKKDVPEKSDTKADKKTDLRERAESKTGKKKDPPEKGDAKTSLFSCGSDGMLTIMNVRSLASGESPKSSSDKTITKPTPAATSKGDNATKTVRTVKRVEISTPETTEAKNKKVVTELNSSFVDIEIKTEPIDLDELGKSSEKNDLLGSLNLRPTSSEDSSTAQKADSTRRPVPVAKVAMPARARKTFPQPRRISPATVSEARTDLNGKNTMVYIPIQPPSTAPPVLPPAPVRVSSVRQTTPVRPTRPVVVNVSSAPNARPVANVITAPNTGRPVVNVNAAPNTTRPVVSVTSARSTTASVAPVLSTTNTTSLATSTPTTPAITQPLLTVATNLMPANVTSNMASLVPSSTEVAPALPSQPNPNVPMLSNINGQWALCLPPINIDQPATVTPMVNGASDSSPSPGGSPAPPYRTPIITPVPTSTLLNTAARELASQPPPLQARPGHPLDPATPIGALPVPSDAGPCTQRINQCAVKLADYFRSLLSESLTVLDDPPATVASLRLQLEEASWRHKQEMAELKHNTDVQMIEIRATMEREKAAAVAEARRAAETERVAAVDLAKSKTWCANCRQEAQFYCCWNTSYCDYPCQQAHWQQSHFSVCTQKREQPPIDTPLDSSSVKAVGGKTLTRPFSGGSVIRTPPAPTSSAAAASVNMQTSSGYKRPQFNQPAYIINKQFQSAEDTTTKVTPGGYLIIGAGNTGHPVVSHAPNTL